MPPGYRAFKARIGDDASDVFLTAAIQDDWSPLEYPLLRAVCPRGRHRPPEKDCTCGYYAFGSVGGTSTYAGTDTPIMSEVWGHGIVQEHMFGWRAEKIQIVRLYWPACAVCYQPAVEYRFDPEAYKWPMPVTFFCDVCKESDIASKGSGKKCDQYKFDFTVPAIGDAAVVMKALADKFRADVYHPAETQKVTKMADGWAADMHRRERHAAAQEQMIAELEAERLRPERERQRRWEERQRQVDLAKALAFRAGRQAPMATLISDVDALNHGAMNWNDWSDEEDVA